MFKKFMYLISVIFGIFFVFKIFSREEKKLEFKYPEAKEKDFVKKEIPKTKVSKTELNSRQRDILKLITKRKVLLPSDIYALHPDVSTRTLRRDMTSLVESNLVRQEGNTRDTRYFLNS